MHVAVNVFHGNRHKVHLRCPAGQNHNRLLALFLFGCIVTEFGQLRSHSAQEVFQALIPCKVSDFFPYFFIQLAEHFFPKHVADGAVIENIIHHFRIGIKIQILFSVKLGIVIQSDLCSQPLGTEGPFFFSVEVLFLQPATLQQHKAAEYGIHFKALSNRYIQFSGIEHTFALSVSFLFTDIHSHQHFFDDACTHKAADGLDFSVDDQRCIVGICTKVDTQHNAVLCQSCITGIGRLKMCQCRIGFPHDNGIGIACFFENLAVVLTNFLGLPAGGTADEPYRIVAVTFDTGTIPLHFLQPAGQILHHDPTIFFRGHSLKVRMNHGAAAVCGIVGANQSLAQHHSSLGGHGIACRFPEFVHDRFYHTGLQIDAVCHQVAVAVIQHIRIVQLLKINTHIYKSSYL